MEISLKSLSVGIFNCLLQYFPKNRAILVQKLWREKSPFLAILRLKKKVPMAIKLEGQGLNGAISGGIFFLRLP